jgi:hypothetical protein
MRMPYPKCRGENFSSQYLHSELFEAGRGGPLCPHSIDCCFVSGNGDITTFHPCSPIATGKILGRAEKITEVAQTTETAYVFYPSSGNSGPKSQTGSARPNLQE